MDFGWRVHAAIQEWTKAADQKASITLVFSVALATLAGREVFDPDGGLYAASGAKLWVVRAMGACFALAAMFALSVVLPRLRRNLARKEASNRLVYFGHLRHRQADEIQRQLSGLTDEDVLSQLARQLRTTSQIAWRKHAHLQAAMVALGLAGACFAVARILL